MHTSGMESTGTPRRWRALVVLLIAAFMDLLDGTIVYVALPSIGEDLDAGFAAMEWVVAAYTLTFAVGLITGGRLGDIFGRRRVFMAGMAGFLGASVVAGLAPTAEVLVAARALQGLMAAVMVPQVLAIVQVIFPPSERVTAFALYGVTLGLAAVVGPMLGGVLTELDLLGLSWRPIFLINVPVGVLGLVAAAAWLPESRSPHPLRLDWVGVVLGAAGVVLIVFPLVEGRVLGWPLWLFAAMAMSIPVFAAFVAWERRKARFDGSPLVDPALFRQRGFVAGLLVSLALLTSLASFWFVLVLWLQVGLGLGAFETALVSVGSPVASMLVAGVAVRASSRLGRQQLALGFGLSAASIALFIALLAVAGDDVTGWHAVPPLILLGLALGLVNPVLFDFILAAVRDEDAGAASGVTHTVQQLGGAVGIAAVGALFFGLLGTTGAAAAQAAATELDAALRTAGLATGAADALASDFVSCFSDRATAVDATVLPSSCTTWEKRFAELPPTQLLAVAPAVEAAADGALAATFTGALRGVLWYHLAAYAVAALLTRLLPRFARKETVGSQPEASLGSPHGARTELVPSAGDERTVG